MNPKDCKLFLFMLRGLATLPSAAYARGGSHFHSGNFLDGLVGLIAVAASAVWLHMSWAHWVARKQSGLPPPRFQGSSDMALCMLGWAFMAILLSLGPLFLLRTVAGKEVALEVWPYAAAALFALILFFKRT